MNSKAVTVTVHSLERPFDEWCTYHQRHFDLVLVMVDDPTEIRRSRRLSGNRLNVQLGAQIQNSSRLTRTLLRQEANATAAVQECVRRGIDWLLHLDGDELFFHQNPCAWDQSPAVGQIIFPNHEACPKWVVANPFREICHFKKNGKVPFLNYQGGKAAVRCTSEVRADGPHRFTGHLGATVVSKNASILHYSSVSFDGWYEKYRRLGLFSDWYKDDFRTPITLDFHLQSREVVHKAIESGDIDSCKRFFARTIWTKQELDRRVASGDLLFISPEKLLSPAL